MINGASPTLTLALSRPKAGEGMEILGGRGRRLLTLSLGTLVFSAITNSSLAQPYPVKPIRILVGFAPGGSTDTISRIIAPRLSERLGQQVIVENRPGAAGNIAAELAAKAAPDGYTVFMASASHSINASLHAKLPFDAVKDFAAITLVCSSPFILVVHPSVPARTTRELITLARSQPGALVYASGGATSHLAGELFNSMAGVKLVHVPYKSSGPASTDLLGGQVSIMFSAPPAVVQHVASQRLRALGTSGARRMASIPDIPTIAESGLPGYEVNSWSGLLGPAAIGREAITRLNADVSHVMALPEIRNRLPALGIEASTNTPDEFAAFLRADVVKWAKVVGEAKVQLH
jgi:tripartite-type tricarboxylate transporter receptor subunit TctC